MVSWRYGLRRTSDYTNSFQLVELFQNPNSGEEWITDTEGLSWQPVLFSNETPEQVIECLERAIVDIKRERGLDG